MNDKYPVHQDNSEQTEALIGSEAQTFRTDVDYCAPENIGLASKLSNGEVPHIVGFLDMTGTINTMLRSAMVRIEYPSEPERKDDYVLWAMEPKDDGESFGLINSENAVVKLTAEEPIILGRKFGEQSHSVDLWNGDKKDISREHTTLVLNADSSVSVAHLSHQEGSGTKLYGFNVESSPETAHNEVLPPEAAMDDDLAVEPEVLIQIAEEIKDDVIEEVDNTNVHQQPESPLEPAHNEVLPPEKPVRPDVAKSSATSQINKDPDAKVFEKRKLSALREAQERLGLSDEATKEQVKNILEEKLNRTGIAMRGMVDFEPTMGRMQREISETLASGKNRLSGAVRHELEGYLNSPYFRELEAIARSAHSHEKFLSRLLAETSEKVVQFRVACEAMVGRGPTFIETDAASRVLYLTRIFPDIRRGLAQENREANELYAQVLSYQEANKLYYEMLESEEGGFRNEQIEEWANELQSKGISPERIKEIESQMQNAVAIEANMVDDPNSPRQWFGNRVIANQNKSRAEAKHTGRESGSVPAQKYVAELMTDILSGKYRNHLLADPIEFLNGTVETGQHRAAALAMIYGKNWQEKAKQMGIRLVEL